jgi:16S rRNA (cytosine1402-N4)-methyltransferase
MSEGHVPVLLGEVLELIRPRTGGQYVDGTFGGGGYSQAILEAADCRVFGIDRDPEAIARGQRLVAHYGGRLTLMEGRFSQMQALLAGVAAGAVDGVVLDVGVSSFQLDTPQRGFSFRDDGPLDMRMSREGLSAADVVNDSDERELADIIFQYGEERHSRRIAHAIVAARPIARTAELAQIVFRAYGPKAASQPIHPATRTFQALRIYVNDELGELERGLAAAETVLRAGGRLAVVAFHSLEDRIVKRFFSVASGAEPQSSRHLPQRTRAAASFRTLTRRPVVPSAHEISLNPRARSARLRAGERLG